MQTVPEAADSAAPHAPAKRLVVVLNPAAGRGQARRRRAELESLLAREARQSNADWEVRETSEPGGGIELARRAADEGADVVAAAGGDGTYGEVATGLAGTGARLAILALGTGNDFARSLGVAGDLPAAVRAAFHGRARLVDIGRCGDRRFINVAGCGFDAVVAERVNRGFRRLRGTSAYVAAVLQSLATFRAAEMRITLDDRAIERRAMLCCVANSQSYGGGMRITPAARIDDGLFDVCILNEAGRVEFLRAFPRVFRGTHVTHPKVEMYRACSVRVESEPSLPVLIDGDVMAATPAEFHLEPSALEVMSL